jgi:hypothetical protein
MREGLLDLRDMSRGYALSKFMTRSFFGLMISMISAFLLVGMAAARLDEHGEFRQLRDQASNMCPGRRVVEHGDASLLETHERPTTDASDHDEIHVLSLQHAHGHHAPAFGVRTVGDDLVRDDLVRRILNVDDAKVLGTAEVHGNF